MKIIDGMQLSFNTVTNLQNLLNELCPNGVEYKTLGEIATDIYRGSGITRNQVTESGTPCVRYGEIYMIWLKNDIKNFYHSGDSIGEV